MISEHCAHSQFIFTTAFYIKVVLICLKYFEDNLLLPLFLLDSISQINICMKPLSNLLDNSELFH